MFNLPVKGLPNEKILFDEITRHLDLEISGMLVRGMFGNGNSTFHSGR